MFTYLGALLAFSFLTMKPFSIDLDTAVWKQIMGHKMDQDDLELYEIVEEGCIDIEGRVQNYFAKFSKQVKAIQEGMDAVLSCRFDGLAYLPLEEIRLRICGKETYDINELKSITEYQFA